MLTSLRRTLDRLIPVTVFLAVTFLLTFRVLTMRYIVLGDNFAWTRQNILDILSPKIVYESYMGDIALLSTFKTGFLFPASLALDSFDLPLTIIYPFLFYLLSMLSFYSLTGEFLEDRAARVVVSLAYVINPVTPYYYISMLNAFALVFLPIALKYFYRALTEISTGGTHLLSRNYVVCSLFIALTISAHEQFLPAIGLLSAYLTLTFAILYLREKGVTIDSLRAIAINNLIFGGVVIAVNLTALLSLLTITRATFANYFTARFQDFLVNVYYTYFTASPETLLRFGGDAGAGLYQDAWFDSNAITNVFGYSIFAVIVVSAIILLLKRGRSRGDSFFFCTNVVAFLSVLAMILFIKVLPSNKALARGLFDILSLPLMSFETPAKLRVLLLLSGLTTTLVGFRELQDWGKSGIKRTIGIGVILGFASSLFIFNSPWVIGTIGLTPVEQIANRLNWGEVYGSDYAGVSSFLGEKYQEARGITIPYTHRSELYSPPLFRTFQLLSNINDVMASLTLHQSVSWDKLLGLLSIRYVALNNYTDTRGWLLFPKTLGEDIEKVNLDIAKNPNMSPLGIYGNYTIYNNLNALPMTYATQYYILYDEVTTLKYALDEVDFGKLPVFIGSDGDANSLTVPGGTNVSLYDVYALGQPDANQTELTLEITNDSVLRTETMTPRNDREGLTIYGVTTELTPGDQLRIINDESLREANYIDELTLNSSWYSLGEFTSFELNFTARLIQQGERQFLSPRVTIHPANTTDYYMIIFQDSGFVELAMLRDNDWVSGILMKYAVYDLRDLNNTINVSINRMLDEVSVTVNESPVFTFPTMANAATVVISSENSTSTFTDLKIAHRDSTRLFAVRQSVNTLRFETTSSNSESSNLIISGAHSDYAVVTQYLETPSRTIDVPDAHPFTANLFFNGWIVDPDNQQNTEVNIDIRDASLTHLLTYASIGFTYMGIVVIVCSSRDYICINKLLKRLGIREAN